MRIRHIEVFHAVYTYGSVTKAAAALNVSQPSVSKVLSHAETQLGYPLFDRSAGRMVPTMEAEQLYGHVASLFDEIGVVRRVAENLKDHGEDRLRIAATPAIGIALLPELVATFMHKHHEIFIELETLHLTEMLSALRESSIDIAIAFDPPTQPGFTFHPLTTGEFVLIKPQQLELESKQPFDLASLGSLPFIRLNTRGPLGQLLDSYLVQEGGAMNVVAATETYHIAHGLVARGVGVAIVDALTANTYKSDQVDIIPLKIPLSFDICAIQFQSAKSSNIRSQFLEHAAAVSQSFLSL